MSSEGRHDPVKALADAQATAEMWRQKCGDLYRINAALLEALERRVNQCLCRTFHADHGPEYGQCVDCMRDNATIRATRGESHEGTNP